MEMEQNLQFDVVEVVAAAVVVDTVAVAVVIQTENWDGDLS